MSGRIRRGQAADRAAVVDCVDAAFRPFIAQIGKPPAPMLADYGALIAAGRVHVVDDGHSIAGAMVLEARGDHLFVDVVAVRPERQRQGVGRGLMAFAEAKARRLGLAEIQLYTHQAMTGALALYRALGYEEAARRLEDGYARVYLRRTVAAER